MKLAYFLLIALLFTITWSEEFDDDFDENNNNTNSSFNNLKEKMTKNYFQFFKSLEDYVIKGHIFIKETLNISHPYDIVAFFVFGALIKLILFIIIPTSCKDTNVYNTMDNAEGLYTIINKIDDIANSINSLPLQSPIVQPSKPSISKPQKQIISKQLQSKISSVSNEIESISSKINNFEQLNEEFYQVIETAQTEINEELGTEEADN